MTDDSKGFGARFLARWIDVSCRWAWPIIAGAVLLSVAALHYTINNLQVDASVDNMLSSDLPFRRHEIANDKAFPQLTGLLSIVVDAENGERADDAAARLAEALAKQPNRFESVFYPEGDPFFRRNGLLYLDVPELEDLSDRLAEAQPLLASINADPTLRGLVGMLRLAFDNGDADAVTALAPALDRMATAVRDLGDGKTAPLSWQALMSDDAAEGADNGAKATARKFILVKPVLNLDTLEPAAAAVDAVKRTAAALGLNGDSGINVRLTGTSLMLQEELETVKTGMGLVGLISLCLVVTLLLIGLRSWRLVIATLVTLVIGLIWTAAFAVAAFKALNIISVAFAVLFIGLSVDFGIHFTMRYREAAAAGTATDAALGAAGRGVGGALFLSAVAAALGFLSFLPTDYRGVSELGVIAGVGMFIALFANLTLLPALLSRMRNIAPPRPLLPAFGDRVQSLLISQARLIVTGVILLGIVATAIVPFAWFDADPLNLRDPDSPSVATLLDIIEDPRTEPYAAEVLVPNLESAKAIAKKVRALPEVRSANAIEDLVPDDQPEKLDIIDQMALVMTPLLASPPATTALSGSERLQSFEALRALLKRAPAAIAPQAKRFLDALDAIQPTPESLRQLEDVLLGGFPKFRDQLAMALSPQTVTLDSLPAAIRERRVSADGQVLVEIHPKEDLRDPAARDRFVEAVRQVVPDVSGSAVRYNAVGDAVVGSFQLAAAIACGLIVLLLFIVLRRVRDVLMVLTPLALAILFTVAMTVVLNTPFNLANIIVLPLILGLGVAFGIQIVLRYRAEADGHLMRTSTPQAVVFSALTTIGSFGALALSDHPGTASMGYLLTLSITLTMICTLVVLPALLAIVARKHHDP